MSCPAPLRLHPSAALFFIGSVFFETRAAAVAWAPSSSRP